MSAEQSEHPQGEIIFPGHTFALERLAYRLRLYRWAERRYCGRREREPAASRQQRAIEPAHQSNDRPRGGRRGVLRLRPDRPAHRLHGLGRGHAHLLRAVDGHPVRQAEPPLAVLHDGARRDARRRAGPQLRRLLHPHGRHHIISFIP